MRKISTGFALSIIAVLAVFFGGVFWLLREKSVVQVPTITSSSPKITENVSDREEKIIYENTEFGFSLELPASWKGYTVLKKVWNESATDLEIFLPTNDKENGILHGFASVLVLQAETLASWNQRLNQYPDCKSQYEKAMRKHGCPRVSAEIGRTEKTVITIQGPQWLPDDISLLVSQSCDLNSAMTDMFVDCFKVGFKALDTKVAPELTFEEDSQLQSWPGASDWKVYRSEQYGFEFKYPKEWFDQTTKANDGLYAFNVYITNKDIQNNYNNLGNDGIVVSISKSKNEKEVSNDAALQSLEDLNGKEIMILDKRNVVVDGNQGVTIMADAKISGCGLRTYFQKNGQSYKVALDGSSCEFVKKHADVYDVLLGTFVAR